MARIKGIIKKATKQKTHTKKKNHTAKTPESLDSAEMNKQAGLIHHK